MARRLNAFHTSHDVLSSAPNTATGRQGAKIAGQVALTLAAILAFCVAFFFILAFDIMKDCLSTATTRLRAS